MSKGHIYFALGFSLLVELLNMRFRKKRQVPVKLHARISDPERVPSESVRAARE